MLSRRFRTLQCPRLAYSATPCFPQKFALPRNVRATTDASEAISGAQYAVHAVPVQHSRAFLKGVRHLLPSDVPIICVSKGLEVATGMMMSEVVVSALERKQPAVFLSGPSFAQEVMQQRPTGALDVGGRTLCEGLATVSSK